jgi:dolichyl-phosphate-mannose--protein O-mannosyl transferase
MYGIKNHESLAINIASSTLDGIDMNILNFILGVLLVGAVYWIARALKLPQPLSIVLAVLAIIFYFFGSHVLNIG